MSRSNLKANTVREISIDLRSFLTLAQVVDFDAEIDVNALKPTLRVALRSDSYTIHRILPNKVDPLVSP